MGLAQIKAANLAEMAFSVVAKLERETLDVMEDLSEKYWENIDGAFPWIRYIFKTIHLDRDVANIQFLLEPNLSFAVFRVVPGRIMAVFELII